MAVRLTYQKLFSLRIYHHYWLDDADTQFDDLSTIRQNQINRGYNIHNFFQIIPTRDTHRVLAGQRALYKKHPFGFDIVVQTDHSASTPLPFVELSEGTRFRFYLIPIDTRFANYTLLPLPNSYRGDGSQKMVYYFTNRDHLNAHAPNLMRPAPAFDNSLATAAAGDSAFAYLTGDLVSDDANNPTQLFEAQLNTNNNTASGDWTNLSTGHLLYANRADQLQVNGSLLNIDFETADITATVQVTDADSNDVFDPAESFDTANDQTVQQLDLRHLPPGKYSMEITKSNGDPDINSTFYLDDELARQNAWGLVEIFADSGLGDYGLTDDGTGELLAPEFNLRFKNRSTRWRYKNIEAQVVHQSSGLLPLTENGFIEELLNGHELPNPSADMILPESDQLYSEYFINEDLFQ